MIRKLALFGVLGLALAACGQTLDAPQAATQELESLRQGADLRTLQPGKFQFIDQKVKVNLVFVGYRQNGPRGVDVGAFKKGLPRTYKATTSAPSYYQPTPEFSGTSFTYDYDVKFADKRFEDSFFGYLSSIAVEKPLTLFQQTYNCQDAELTEAGVCTTPSSNIGKVIDKNYWIDAPKVEKWLAYNSDRIGVNTREYTVFMVNWFDRPDFKFHVYTKTNEVDPETGYNFGELRNSRKMAAWGGTTPDDEENGLGKLARLWFFDLSAGPEFNTGMYDITNADTDGDNELDYRMPPVWDYNTGKTAYRPFNDLSGDLSKIVRYVGINLLFTTSPSYRAALTPPVMPDTVKIVGGFYQGLPGVDGKQLLNKQLFLQELSELQPLTKFKLEAKDLAYTPEIKAGYECLATGTECYPGVPSFASMFISNLINLNNIISFDQNNYELPMLSYVVPDNVPAPFLGLADDDWNTGTQSFVYGIYTPDIGTNYGLTTTQIHEVGHHLAMTHPHNGYDFENGVEYGPSGPYAYAWFGDQSNSMMSYIDLNWDFSQFDRDNMSRYLVASYVNQSNTILGEVLKSPKASLVRPALQAADRLAGEGLEAYKRMDYLKASVATKAAYKTVLEVAKGIGVEPKPFRWYEAYGVNPTAQSVIPKINTRVDKRFEMFMNQVAMKKRMAP
jgi:hypothetical protein